MRARSGFTLIELSVVLIIIGLIVSGVLVGQDLIKAAELRKTVSQIASYNSAVNTFRGKYNCLPGDCKDAQTFGLATASGYGTSGDGDGIINFDTSAPPTTGGEMSAFWYHLASAQLIDWSPPSTAPGLGNGYQQNTSPLTKMNTPSYGGRWKGRFEVYYARSSMVSPPAGIKSGRHYWWIVGFMADGSGTDFTGDGFVLTPVQAWNLDQKYDDGLPLSGSAIAAGTNSSMPVQPDAALEGVTAQMLCLTNQTLPSTYNLKSTNALCTYLQVAAF